MDTGAKIIQEIKDVGECRQIISVKDADGNIMGLIQTLIHKSFAEMVDSLGNQEQIGESTFLPRRSNS